jgi:hypothetical protein
MRRPASAAAFDMPLSRPVTPGPLPAPASCPALATAFACALAFALAFAPAAHAAGEFKARGFTLPSGAVRVDDDRYRLPQNWEEGQRWYRSVYPPGKFPRRTLANQGGVRAIHLVNPKPDEEWQGVNFYEVGKGEVRVFVLARPGFTPEPEAPAPKGKSK